MATARRGKKAAKKIIVIGKKRRTRRVSGVGRTHHRAAPRAQVRIIGRKRGKRRVSGTSMNGGNILKKGMYILGGVAAGAYGTHFVLTPVRNWIANNFPALAPAMKIFETAAGFYLIIAGKSILVKAVGAGILGSEQIVKATQHLIPGMAGYNEEYQVLKMPMTHDVQNLLSGLINSDRPTYTHQVSGLHSTPQVSGMQATPQISATSTEETEELETYPLARW